MLELLINGEMRVSTALKLIAQNWYLLGAIALLFIGCVSVLFKRLNDRKSK